MHGDERCKLHGVYGDYGDSGYHYGDGVEDYWYITLVAVVMMCVVTEFVMTMVMMIMRRDDDWLIIV